VRLEELERAHPEAEVQLWAEDEARWGLKPVMRRVWAPVGKRPVVPASRGATNGPISTASCTPRVERCTGSDPAHGHNVELFSMALDEFAKEVGAGEDKHILLVVDKAG
jgi:hypothetical protein